MTNYKRHHLYHIAPAADLASQASAAFKAAIFLLVAMKKVYGNGQIKSAEFDRDALHRELRSFFWELASSYEIMLHWTNRAFDLRIDEHKVCQDTVLSETPKSTLSSEDQARLAFAKKRIAECLLQCLAL